MVCIKMPWVRPTVGHNRSWFACPRSRQGRQHPREPAPTQRQLPMGPLQPQQQQGQVYQAAPQYALPPPQPEPSFWSQIPPIVYVGIGGCCHPAAAVPPLPQRVCHTSRHVCPLPPCLSGGLGAIPFTCCHNVVRRHTPSLPCSSSSPRNYICALCLLWCGQSPPPPPPGVHEPLPPISPPTILQ